MSYNHVLPKKVSLKPKKHHGFQFFLFLLGFLLPPLGKDLFINIILCICGYFPCHFHNFYIQNIRNNTNRARTPKWALKAGLINTDDRDRRARKNEWSKRFEQRNAQSAHVGQALEEGEEGDDYMPVSDEQLQADRRRAHEGLWEDEDAEYYNPDEAPNQRNWHYPMNFEGAASGSGRKQKKKAVAGDRWERASRSNSTSSGSTYPPAAAVDEDVPEWGRDYGSTTRRSTKNKQQQQQKAKQGRGGWADGYADDVSRDDGWGASNGASHGRQAQKQSSGRSDDVFNHEF